MGTRYFYCDTINTRRVARVSHSGVGHGGVILSHDFFEPPPPPPIKADAPHQGFPYWGGGWGESPPLAKNLVIPPTPGKIPPQKIFVPPPTKHSFPPLNNNFLNGQNHSLSGSHHPIKKSPHCTGRKGFSPYPFKLFGKFCPPSL